MSVLDLAGYREEDRKMVGDFVLHFSGAGQITIVMDPTLMAPLNIVLARDSLARLGVSQITTVNKLDSRTAAGQNRNFCWLIRPDTEMAQTVAKMIGESRPAERHIVAFIPRRARLCDDIMEGVKDRTERIVSLPLDLVPLDDDVLSMELPHPLRSALLDNDYSVCYDVAHSIMRLQESFGVIPKIYGKGDLARKSVNILKRLMTEADSARDDDGFEAKEEPPAEIGQLVIIDRTVDLATPMLTQLTYEGILDEMFGIKCSHLSVPAKALLGKNDEPLDKEAAEKPRIYALNSNDKIFSDLRDLNAPNVRQVMTKFFEDLSEFEASRPSANNMQQLAEWTKKFALLKNQEKYAKVHLRIFNYVFRTFLNTQEFQDQLSCEQNLLIGEKETISGRSVSEPFIEECVQRGEPFIKVLRLLVLHSQAFGGMKSKNYDTLKKDIFHTYGLDAIFTLQNLEKLGIIVPQDAKCPFSQVRRNLNLRVDLDETDLNPQDPAYVFSGFSPVIPRLVQAAERPGGWAEIEETLRILPGGEAFEEDHAPQADSKPVTLVYVIGGVTFAEISAIRLLAQLESGSHSDYIIATTNLANGGTLVSSFMETLPKPMSASEERKL